MNINEFAKYLLDADSDKAESLWSDLYSKVSLEEDRLNEILELIADNKTPENEEYLGDLIEWLNYDNYNADYVNEVINQKWHSLYDLLSAAKLEKDEREYYEVENKLEELLSEFDEDDELPIEVKEYNVDDILSKL